MPNIGDICTLTGTYQCVCGVERDFTQNQNFTHCGRGHRMGMAHFWTYSPPRPRRTGREGNLIGRLIRFCRGR